MFYMTGGEYVNKQPSGKSVTEKYGHRPLSLYFIHIFVINLII